jgi:hypothetical protein
LTDNPSEPIETDADTDLVLQLARESVERWHVALDILATQ